MVVEVRFKHTSTSPEMVYDIHDTQGEADTQAATLSANGFWVNNGVEVGLHSVSTAAV